MSESEPNIWCLLGRKAGDNTQVLSLAEALGWPFTEKHIQARAWELLPHLLLRVTLAGIDRRASTALAPPWPDLVISAGRRNEPVAHWIRKQSGGRTRLVHIGRPWAQLDSWDLIITTPQYFLPRQPNIVHNQLPLHRLHADKLALAADRWRRSLGHMPQPRVAVLVGGDSGKFVFTADKGKRLGQRIQRLAAGAGGSLLIAGSPRTPDAVFDALAAQVQVPNFSYRWGQAGDNPYEGFLALADAFVVTGESMSMLGEASATGKPLFIFDMGDGAIPWWRSAHNFRYKPLSHRLAMALGPRRMRRDIGKIQQALVASGQAQWLTDDSALSSAVDAVHAAPGNGELEASAEAVRQLLRSR